MKHLHLLHQRNSTTIAAIIYACLHCVPSRADTPTGLTALAVPIALFSLPETSMATLHRQSLYLTKHYDETVKTLSMTRETVSRRRRGRNRCTVHAPGDINAQELRRSSMIIMRTFPPKAPSRRARSVLWGGSIGGESDEEMNDGGGNDGKEHKPAEDLSIDLGVTLGDVSGSNGGQKASFGETYSLTESEDEMKVESFLPSVMRNGRDPTTPNDAVGNEGIRVPRFFPTSSDEEEEGGAVKQIIELPLDGILLQLIPALLIVVLGLFLTVAIQVEAGRFDAMVGEDGGTAVVVTDLRDLENVSP